MKNLFSALVVQFLILFLAVGCTTSKSQNTFSNIDGAQMQTMMKDTSVVVIDVRTPGEVAEGYIKGATVFLNYNGENFASQVAALDKSKTYIVYCRSGGRSSGASAVMVEKGFSKVYNLSGGITGYSGPIVK